MSFPCMIDALYHYEEYPSLSLVLLLALSDINIVIPDIFYR